MSRSGRSSLVDMRAPAPRRPRPWALRRTAVVLAAGALGMLGWAVGTEAFSPAGPGRLLYLLHDHLFVPAWAWLWVRNGPWSLLWWVPLALLAALVTVEFLGLGQPLRRLQVGVLRLALRSAWGGGVVALHQAVGGRGGLLVQVLRAELAQAEAAAKAAVEDGDAAAAHAARLGRAAARLARLRAGDEDTQVRCAEALALIEAQSGMAAAAPWRARLRRLWSGPVADGIEAAALLPAEGAEAAVAGLLQGSLPPHRLALLTLGMAGGSMLARPDLMGAWLTEWARLRHRPVPPRPDLAEAERLIDFEFWAARIEAALAGAALAGDRSGWLAALLPDAALRRPLGEIAAAQGGPAWPG